MKYLLRLFLSSFFFGLFLVSCQKDDPQPGTNPDTSNNYKTYDTGEGEIGTSGGEITVTDSNSEINGASITIPEGALNTDNQITISDAQNISINGSEKNVVEYEPSGLTFEKPVKIGIPISEGDNNNIVVYHYDNEENSFNQLELSNVDQQNKIAYAYTEHFSKFFAGSENANLYVSSGNLSDKLAVFSKVYSNLNDIPYSDSQTIQEYLDNLNNNTVQIAFNYELYKINANDVGVLQTGTSKTLVITASAETNISAAQKLNLNFSMEENGQYTEMGLASGITREDFLENWITGYNTYMYYDLNELGLTNDELRVKFSWSVGQLTDNDKSNNSNIYSVNSSNFNSDNVLTLGDINDYDENGIPDQLEKYYFTDDRDGKTYKAVKIGEQVWMAENLAYLPGLSLPSEVSDTEPNYFVNGYSGTSVTEAKATDNYNTYGVLYNWAAAQEEVCPSGWHLPSDDEWKQLEMFIGMSQSEADGELWRGTDEATKLQATYSWVANEYFPVENGTDDYGFSALAAGGYYIWDDEFIFNPPGQSTGWWNSSIYNRGIGGNSAELTKLFRADHDKASGASVRCVKD